MKPKALDLFCSAGGATCGLQLAGFHVTGVDIKPQPRYVGDAFHQADALAFPLGGFDFIWASPPCQRYSVTMNAQRGRAAFHPDLVDPTRDRLRSSGVPWVIENVRGAPLARGSLKLCGSSFGLRIWRHRWFETPFLIIGPACRHDLVPLPLNPYKSTSRKRDGITGTGDPKWKSQMGVQWMSGDEASNAIPPAYAQWIGEQMMPHVLARKAVA